MKKNNLRILIDSIRDSRDLAEIIHLAIATGRKADITGNSILLEHSKAIGLIDSWKPGFREKPEIANVSYSQNFFERIKELKKQGFEIIGTSPSKGNSIFKTDLSKGKQVIVFGTETGGLGKAKLSAMNRIVRVPMLNKTRFYTLRTIVPIIVHEALRQKGFFD